MLGGNTIVMDQGRVLQKGPTIEVYHRPASERVGQVFSDPPMNMIEGEVAEREARLGSALRVPLSGHLAGIAPGGYRFGVRANHLSVARGAAEEIEFTALVELAEISGSETFIHATHGDASWVVQEEGVHSIGLGEEVKVFIDPRRLFVFDRKGGLVAAPRDATSLAAAQ
jgi:glycerol transport system ATP-binding protein